MEENTMSKNDAEGGRSMSDGQRRDPSVESGQRQREQRIGPNSVGPADAEQRAGKSQKSQSGSRTSQGSGTRTSESSRLSQAGEVRTEGSRRASRVSEEEQAIRRSGRISEEEQAIRRASRASEEEQAIRRASRASEEERAKRRANQASEEERAIRRASRTSEEERAKRRARRAAVEENVARDSEIQSGKFGLGHQKTRRSAISYLFEDIAEAFVRAKNWCVKNYRTSIPAAICLVLVIVVACILVRNFRMQPAPVSGNTDNKAAEYPLELNAYEHVNSFFQRYYEASTFGDVDTYVSMRSYTDEAERIRMRKKANYIDYYQNLNCYTKPGPVENSYLVYVYYEVKFRGIDTTAPGLKTFYLCTNDAGELYVFSGDVDQNAKDYMRTVSTQDDVKDLFNRVKVTYNNAVASDKELEEFLATLAENLKNEVTLALREQEELNQSGENGDGDGGDTEPDPIPEEPEPTPEVEPEPQTDMVVTMDRVNVRSSASPEATKLGTVAAGTRFTRYETLENGWSKIDYEGREAYIKTEYLQVIEASVGKVKTIESVNIRASASENATKLGTVSVGTTLELIENQENGWSRILFNGSTAYVKTEYLEPVTSD